MMSKEEEETQMSEEEEETQMSEEAIQKMIQSETDKVRTEYSQQVKELQEEKEALEKEKMSEEEKRQFDLDEMQKSLEEKEGEIQNRELTILTVDLLKENDLPLDFREYVIGQDKDSTIERVEKFDTLWTSALKDAVDERFKDNGRDIASTKTGTKTIKTTDFLDMANNANIRK